MGWYFDNSAQMTYPVGQKVPNPWGLHDMHGNVSEWCGDCYGDYPSGSVTDPIGPSQGTLRVLRGGSWISFARDCRSARRNRDVPSGRSLDMGFRVAVVPSVG